MKARMISCIVAAVVAAGAPSAIGGLAAYYPFDSDLTDAAGDNDGTGVNGASITTAAGEFVRGAGALKLVRSSKQYVKVNGLSNDLATGDAFSLTGWFRTSYNPPGNNQHQLFSAHDSGGGNIFRTGTDTDGGIFLNPGDSPDDAIGSGYSDGAWHLLSVTETPAGTTTVKVDNKRIPGFRDYVTAWNSATQYSIGQEYDGGAATDHWDGLVDDLAVWDHALSAGEIGALYKGYSPASLPTQITRQFQQGVDHGFGAYAGTQDTYIADNAPGSSYGGSTAMWVDGPGDVPVTHGLVRFDNIIGNGLGQVPPGISILSAELTLTTGTGQWDPGGGADFHPMLVPWAESATWGGSFGGDGIQPNDMEASAVVEYDTGAMGFGAHTFDVTDSVQAWANGQTNYGWALLPKTADGWAICTSEYGTASWRPLLEVTFVPEPGTLALFGLSALGLARARRRRHKSSP